GAGRASGIPFGAVLVERQPDHHPYHVVGVHVGEELEHGEPLADAPGEGRERLGEDLGLVRDRDPDPFLAPVHPQQPPAHPWDMVAKNSWFALVRFIRSSRNSIASTGGMSARKLRSK